MDEVPGGEAEYESFWRVVPVVALPFPFHLFRCPFVERHLRALQDVGAQPDDYATPEQRSRAFRLFVPDVAAGLTTCRYHQPDWNLAAERAVEAVRRGPTEACSRVRRCGRDAGTRSRSQVGRAAPQRASPESGLQALAVADRRISIKQEGLMPYTTRLSTTTVERPRCTNPSRSGCR